MLDKKIKKYDCFIFNYHDHALISFKILSKFRDVNYNSGLDFLRVSLDYGAAYDLIGKNNANNKSLLYFLNAILKISKNQIIN